MDLPPDFEPLALPGFAAVLGPVGRQSAGGPADGDLMRMAIRPDHLEPDGTVAPGILMMAAQTALQATVARAAPDHGHTNVSLTCDFVPLVPDAPMLEAATGITRRTRSIIFMHGEIRAVGGAANERRVLMTATGLWKIAPRNV